MNFNNVSNNQYSIPPVHSIKSDEMETMITSANTMPITTRPVHQPSFSKNRTNNMPPNYLRQVYMGNQSASHGSLTESFIKSRASFSPTYMHNEVTTRYNMISKIPLMLSQIKKVNITA